MYKKVHNTVYMYRGSIDLGGANNILKFIATRFAKRGFTVNIIYRQMTDMDFYNYEHFTTDIRSKIKLIHLSMVSGVRCKQLENIRKQLPTSRSVSTPVITIHDYPVYSMLRDIRDVFNNKRTTWIHMDTNHPTIVHKNMRPFLSKYNISDEMMLEGPDIIRTESPEFKKYYPDTVEVVPFYNTVTINHNVSPRVSMANELNILNINGLREDRKTIIPFLESITKLSNVARFKLKIVGEINAHLYNQAKKLITDNRLEQYVEIIDYVNDMHEIYDDANICVTTATYEGISNALLECMNYGIPVLSMHECVGTNELIVHDVNGRLCETPDDIVSDIMYLHNDSVAAHKLSTSTISWARTNTNKTNGTDKYLSLIRKSRGSIKNEYFQNIKEICDGEENCLLPNPWQYV